VLEAPAFRAFRPWNGGDAITLGRVQIACPGRLGQVPSGQPAGRGL